MLRRRAVSAGNETGKLAGEYLVHVRVRDQPQTHETGSEETERQESHGRGQGIATWEEERGDALEDGAQHDPGSDAEVVANDLDREGFVSVVMTDSGGIPHVVVGDLSRMELGSGLGSRRGKWLER